MRNYEILYIIDGSLSDEDKEKVVLAVKDVIEKAGGTCEEPDRWGMKKYTYPINYKTEGYYVLVNFTAESNVPNKLGALLSITNNIMRYIIVAK